MRQRRTLPALVSLLLLCAAGLFVYGTRLERSSERKERAAEQPARVEPTPRPTAPIATPHPTAESRSAHERAEGGGGEEHTGESAHPESAVAPEPSEPRVEHAGREREAAPESFVGLNPDSTPAVASAVVVSVLLAALVVALPSEWPLLVVALVSLGFAVLDVREVIHQVSRSASSLVAIASGVGGLHLAAAAVCVAAARRNRGARTDRGGVRQRAS